MNYGKKYHYMIKYVVIGLPIIMILLSMFCYSVMNDTIIYDYAVNIQNGVYTFMNALKQMPLNSFYTTLLSAIGFSESTGLTMILEYYPLYIMWVYIFDIIVDIFCLLPKLFHNFIQKFGGGDY